MPTLPILFKNMIGGIGGATFPTPNPSDLVYLLNGEINEDQLIDQVNGYNFTINNKDFDSDGYVGIPFKTKATISAPSSGDAKTAVLGVDVNNFWYDETDTPKQVPISAFFQNIDFANQLFCRHTEREVNDDLEEVSPPLLTDIVGYSSAQTIDSSFTDYFGAIIERPTDATNIFVSKDGNDSTGDGSWATPYLTIQKAWAEANTGDSVYVLGGTYDETDYLNIDVNKIVSFTGIGNTTITSSGTSRVIFTYRGTVTFNHFYIDAESNTNDVFYIQQHADGDVTINKCCLMDSTGDVIDTAFGASAPIQINDSYISTALELEAAGYVITGCYSTAYINSNGTFQYNKFESISSQVNLRLIQSGDADVRFNKFTHQDIAISGVKDSASVFRIERNTFYSKAGGTAFRPISIANGVGTNTNTCVASVKYNYFQCDHETTQVISIHSEAFLGCEIEYNVIICNHESASFRGIQPGIDWNTGSVKIRYNRIFTEARAGYGINLGETGGSYFDGAEIVGNYVRGHLYNSPEDTGYTLHGITAARGVNIKFAYNRIEYCPLAFTIKGGAVAYTSEGCYGNVIYECESGFYVRQTDGVKVYNNTFANNSILAARYGSVDDEDGSNSDNVVFQNNIFHSESHSVANGMFFIDEDVLNRDGILFDNNIYDPPGAVTRFIIDDAGTPNYYTYAQAETNNWAVNGDVESVTFTDLATGDLTLETGSNGIGDGDTLDAAYDDNLDESTDWNRDDSDVDPDNYPEIITKQQTAPWDRGAYVS